MSISEHIEIDPEKRFGKPVVKGTRIAVSDVLNWLANGMSMDQIKSDFPELSEESIRACLLFAASHESHIGFAS